ncbi:MAG: peptide chain release factor N(5)-glutamine methyltransferase [Chloroflexia bacterium]|nr:peptide chain release factor N(5)-glutamine methyltransferase [Chloroflexia bacterium]
MLATITDLITGATVRIRDSGSASPRLDAEVLFRHVAGLDRTTLFLALRDNAREDHIARFHDLVERRIAGQPVAYLVGKREFMGLSFAVTPDVLIPRPETELLVEWALTRLGTLGVDPINVVDVGAGSGAIAVSITALGPVNTRVLGIEPSPSAREVIERNATELLTDDQRTRFTIAGDDLLSDHPGPFNMVLANLPYLTPEQLAGNPDLAAEPRLALSGGADGLDLVRRLIAQLPGRLTDTCAVGLEIDTSQSDTVATLLKETIPNADVSIVRDLAGHDRHVVAVA